ncbi:sugar ABC transporter permease [Paenibacillus sp. CGMCC 1.16610]|uniref:ABC transporter permease subunit n=1 Tax=Paenibacillus anseongense TaxID=2682845 RepID=A0ABW9U4X3_9BACL|nr:MULTISPECIES: sugar ABC transporter permease [Paenibacillus]MBA2939114.1 sugar ABC transporter permease [Paenibacillus sp. CGMCC 1.16610]MVQ35073.1 ABC transporter permease subunit [Paenibacillus anseongense]
MHTLKGTKFSIFIGLLPALVIYLGIAVVPIGLSLYYSAMNWDGISPMTFIGLDNFIEIMKDPIFWNSLKNNIFIMIAGIVGTIPFGLLLALLLNKKLKGSGFFRTVGFLPVVISSVIVSLIWGMIYNTEYGMLNSVLGLFGLDSLKQNWLGSTEWSMLSISITYIWQNCGLYMVILLAALQNIPAEVNEAAHMDGATGLKKTFLITIPMIRDTLVVAIVYSISGSFRVFDLIQVMTGGGPAHYTEVMTIYMYNNAFVNMRFGYGSAVSILILVFSLIVVTVVNKLGMEKKR